MTLAAKNLSITYGGKSKSLVVQDINLSIEAGEILVLQGPNGAGKSTIVKAFARHLKPCQGEVAIDGKDIWQMAVHEFAKLVAYVPQTLNTPPAMTVRDLVGLGRAPHQKIFQISQSESDEAIIEAALARCELSKLAGKFLSELSGGERQRTIIAMAICQKPKYLLLDEPTASLDYRHQLELTDLLLSLKEEGLGIALILHDLNLAAGLSAKIALLGGGESQPSTIVACGDRAHVFARETLQKVFAVDVDIYPSLTAGGADLYIPKKL
jgi:iron complex transport system ATP-binding protein